MNKLGLLLLICSLLLLSCNSIAPDKEKELLQKEIELLKKEKELLAKEKENKAEKKKAKEEPEIKKEVITPKAPEAPVTIETDLLNPKYLIQSNKIGDFTVGIDIPFPEASDYYKMNKEMAIRETDEGTTEEPAYIVTEGSERLLSLSPGWKDGDFNKTISSITVLSKKFKTSSGIGIGSTIEDFIDTYPDFRVWYTYISRMYVLESKSLKCQFIFNEKDYRGELNFESEQHPLKISDFRNGSKIMSIRAL